MFQNLQRESYYLGNLVGVPIFVHWSVIVLVILVSSTSFGGGFEHILLILVVLVLGILLHELGHALMARACGAFGITITLWALGGLCSSRRDFANLRREIAIVAAGPAVSLALSLGSAATLTYLETHQPGLVTGPGGDTLLGKFLVYSDYVNWSLFLFNMLPIFPLDGGQLTLYGTMLVTRNQLLARQMSLFLAIFGSIAYFLYRTGFFVAMQMGTGQGVELWIQHLGLGDLFVAFMLAYLVRSAWIYLR